VWVMGWVGGLAYGWWVWVRVLECKGGFEVK